MIYETILQQLGGRRFQVMTGTKNFVYDSKEPNFLRMDLQRNKSGANRLKITLDANDTYTMHFYKGSLCKKTFDYKMTKQQTFEGVYCDMLQDIFTKVTGMYTSL